MLRSMILCRWKWTKSASLTESNSKGTRRRCQGRMMPSPTGSIDWPETRALEVRLSIKSRLAKFTPTRFRASPCFMATTGSSAAGPHHFYLLVTVSAADSTRRLCQALVTSTTHSCRLQASGRIQACFNIAYTTIICSSASPSPSNPK